jgi:hypothetical protein
MFCCYFLHFGVVCLFASKCVYRLLFNKIVIVELVLAMEWTFSHLVFVLGGNADHDERMVGVGASKMARARCNVEIRGRTC